MDITNISSAFLTLNAMTTFSVALVSLLIGKKLVRRGNNNLESKSFGLFWLMSTPIWFFSLLGSIALFAKSVHFFTIFEYTIQVFVPFQLTFGLLYFLVKFFGSKKFVFYLTTVYFFISLIYFFLFLRDETEIPEFYLYGADVIPSMLSQLLFSISFSLPFALAIIDLVIRSFKILIKEKREELGKILATISILIYGVAGLLDELGFLLANWRLMTIRLLLLVGTVLAYFCYENSDKQVELKTLPEIS